MEKSSVKKKMSTIDIENKENVEFYLNSKIYTPGLIEKSITEEDIYKIYNEVKTSNILSNLKCSYNSECKINLKDTETFERLKRLVEFNKNMMDMHIDVRNNANKYIRKNSKINTKQLEQVIINIPKTERTFSTIRNEYNKESTIKVKSNNSIRRVMKEIHHFRYISPDLKPRLYFKTTSIEKQFIFIHLIINDINLGYTLYFFDECGVNGIRNSKKIWIHPKEDKIAQANRTYKNYNLLVVCNNCRIEKYQINTANSKVANVKIFLEEFILKIGKMQAEKSVIIMDNHRIHKDENLLRDLCKKVARIIFIPEYHAEFNFIEFIFNILKKNLIAHKNQNK